MNWLCKRGWHKYRARYTIINPTNTNIENCEGSTIVTVASGKHYVHDVCERCGKVLKK